MKYCFGIALLCVLFASSGCQPGESHLVLEVDNSESASLETPVLEVKQRTVDASCGQCQFGMSGQGCDLAIRMDNQVYYVDGSSIDSHGDAHADDGLCNCVRKAVVSGKVVNGRFIASDVRVMDLSAPSAVLEED